jgi:hypothetical protein
MKFLISGASSNLSRKIGQQLKSLGHDVKMIGRGTSPEFNLDKPTEDLLELFKAYEIFIHLAHSHRPRENLDVNEFAAQEITRMVDSPQVSIKCCIYISSDSANVNAKSTYGKSKYKTERVFLESKKGSVLRLGVITDEDVKSPYQSVKKFSNFLGFLIFPQPHLDIFTRTNVKNIVETIVYISENQITGGPYAPGESLNRESMVSLLRKDEVKLRKIIGIPSSLINMFCFFGKRIPGLNRISDSLLSIQVPPEEKIILIP